jgi:hypothetical protein
MHSLVSRQNHSLHRNITALYTKVLLPHSRHIFVCHIVAVYQRHLLSLKHLEQYGLCDVRCVAVTEC